jgi:hypothetical protein
MLGCHDHAMSHPLQVLAPVKKERYILYIYFFILVIYLIMVYLRVLSVVQ